MSDLQATRWCSAGDSALDDGEEAAFEAVTRALATPQPGGTLDPADTVLAVVFASSRHDLGRVAAGLRCALPQSVHVVGCTTSGEIFGGASRNSGLAVMLFGGEGFSVRTASATGLSHDSAGTGERAAELLYLGEPEPSPEEPERDVVLLLSDGLAGDQQAMVTGVYRVTGAAVPLVGGCAGDDLAMVATYQLIGGPDGDRVLQDSVVGVRLRSDAPIGIGVRHGWRRVGSPLVRHRYRGRHRAHAGRRARPRRLSAGARGAPRGARGPGGLHPVRPRPPARHRRSQPGPGPLRDRRRLRRAHPQAASPRYRWAA